jgi:hypothetical protein
MRDMIAIVGLGVPLGLVLGFCALSAIRLIVLVLMRVILG